MPKPAVRLLFLVSAVTGLAIIALAHTPTPSVPVPNFNRDVAPILFKHCANCHREGEIVSAMPLVSYDNARAAAHSIKETVLRREMPPWPADPAGSVAFGNDPRLSQQEIDTLVAWVDQGTPKGNDADLPQLPVLKEGWLHPKGLLPDAVITLPTYRLPATGEIPYASYLAKLSFPEDKWIVAIQVRPSNRAVVHHMAITEVALNNGMTPADLDRFTRAAQRMGITNSSLGTRPAVADPANPQVYDMLAVYTPGTTFEMYEDGSAKLLKAGTNMYLNFNIHYQTTGKPEVDEPTLALWFQPGPPKHQLYRVPASGETIIANGKELLTDAPGERAEGTGLVIPPVPPFADNYELIGITGYTRPVTIYQFQPHAHLRGKDFKYSVVYPDGREETLLTIPKYKFHWQLAYVLEKPLQLPAGSKLVVTAHYDNSAQNQDLMHGHGMGDRVQNSGPEKEVYFREQNQSWDEMFTPFIQYSIDSPDLPQPGEPEPSQREPASDSRSGEEPAPNTLAIAEVVGCLDEDSSKAWVLNHASSAADSQSQATSSVDLKAATTLPLGNHTYQLLGVGFFNPSSRRQEKVAVKGVLIKDAGRSRINVTSLQTVSTRCVP
jgi:hypothetical protein